MPSATCPAGREVCRPHNASDSVVCRSSVWPPPPTTTTQVRACVCTPRVSAHFLSLPCYKRQCVTRARSPTDARLAGAGESPRPRLSSVATTAGRLHAAVPRVRCEAIEHAAPCLFPPPPLALNDCCHFVAENVYTTGMLRRRFERSRYCGSPAGGMSTVLTRVLQTASSAPRDGENDERIG